MSASIGNKTWKKEHICPWSYVDELSVSSIPHWRVTLGFTPANIGCVIYIRKKDILVVLLKPKSLMRRKIKLHNSQSNPGIEFLVDRPDD